MWKPVFLVVFFILFLPCVLGAVDQFRPYLHKASVPDSPKLQLYGQYETLLFPGAAAYSYPILIPKGTGIQPSLSLTYNSQSMKQRPGIVGAGWSLTGNFIIRNINLTTGNILDDNYLLSQEGSTYELTYGAGQWHTTPESFLKIENKTGYWLITKPDGIIYRFGYNADSQLQSNTGKDYGVKWSLDLIQDTFGNSVRYSYLEDPTSEDTGAVYPIQITYNNESSRVILFTYENNTRPDRHRVVEQGNFLEESRRLTDISIYAEGKVVRRLNLTYVTLSPSLSTISTIRSLGADNQSVQYTITLQYYLPQPGYQNDTRWQPPVAFSNSPQKDFGVRLEDLNNDGFMDVLQGRGDTAEKKVWINNKLNNWTLDTSWVLPQYLVVGSNNYDEGIRFGDVNRDGLIDILHSRAGDQHEVFLNNGSGWVNATVNWTIPLDIAGTLGSEQGVQVIDLDGDSRVDFVKAFAGEPRFVYLNNGSGWTNKTTEWNFPADFVNIDSDDRGTRLVDLNGDGLPDVVQAGYYTGKSVWLNNGTGFTNASYYNLPVLFTTITNGDGGIRFMDANGDGMVDVIEDFYNGSLTERGAWLNTGRGWQSNTSWQAPEAFSSNNSNIGRRVADLTGDGFGDIVVAYDTNLYSWTKNATFPYLLKSMVNEYGGVTTINYTDSTQFNNSEDGTPHLGFNVFVVGNVTINGSVVSSIAYNYSFGKYDYAHQEFLGFGKTTEKKESGETWHYFLQDKSRKGKEFKTEVYGLNNSLFSTISREFVSVLSSVGSDNVSLHSVSSYLYDGKANPKIVNVTYRYDSFGNVVFMQELGDTAIVGDERNYNYTYAANKDHWIVNRVSSARVYDADGTQVKESVFYYDYVGFNGVLSQGALTKKEDWNNAGNNTLGTFSYDAYGNVIKQTDSLGNSVSYSYDYTHTYPVSITNALKQTTLFQYDLGTGNLRSSEKNGIKTSYEYDTFGRISKEIQPLDSPLSPTKSYIYNFDGVAPENIVMTLKTTSNNSNVMRYYYDGFAQLVQLKTDIENNQQVVKNIFYDGMGRVKAEQNPFFSISTTALTNVTDSPNATYTYDVMDRVIGVRNTDGTTKNISYHQYNITDYDENGNRIEYTLNGYGQIANVTEFYNDPFIYINESYVTSYRYDTNGNLVKITDSQGNEFKFGYDSLNRKVSMDDPDLGVWMYKYDQNGNLIFQSGGGGNLVSGDGYYREYDGNGHLLKVRQGNVSTSALLEEYLYDQDGQRIKIKRNDSANTIVYTPFKELMRVVNNTGSYDFTYIYQDGTLVARKNPDETTYFYHDDHLGSVSVLTNGTGSVLENTYYSPYGEELSGGDKEFRGYTGQFDDEATGQMYYGARYYKPSLGQLISPDLEIQNAYDPQFLNHYMYVRGNPYRMVDPDGRNARIYLNKDAGILPGVGPVGHIVVAIDNPTDYTHSTQIVFGNRGLGSGLKGELYGYDYDTSKSFDRYFVSIFGSERPLPEFDIIGKDELPENYDDFYEIEQDIFADVDMIKEGLRLKNDPEVYNAFGSNSQHHVAKILAAGKYDYYREWNPQPTTVFYYNMNNNKRVGQQRRTSNGQADALERYWADKREREKKGTKK